jgi:O-antigen/teichoic acid export membrane protein
MQQSKIFSNSIAAMVEVIIVGIGYFVLYRYLLRHLGIELLGVWALIISSTSFALIANFGISTSIVKFVATYYAKNEFDKLRKLIFTAILFVAVSYSIVSIIILIFGLYAIPFFIEDKYISIAFQILPFSLISLIINVMGITVGGCLDGIQKNYIKSYIVSLTSLLLLILSLLLTPKYGLKGLVFSQIIQSLTMLLLTTIYLSKSLKHGFSLKWNWSNSAFKEIINYGLKMQALSFMQMLFEPITKGLLSNFGGLAMVGYYEMGSRLVSQLGSLIIKANQVIVPVVAEAREKNEFYINQLYKKSFSIVLFFDVILISALTIASPIISLLWLGKIVPFFLFVVILNSSVIFVNIISNTAYFSYLGKGELKWLIYSYIAVTVLNPLLGYVLGLNFNAYGVVLGWNLSFLVNSLLVLFSYHKNNNILWAELISPKDTIFIISAVIFSATGYYIVLSYFHGLVNYLLLIFFTAFLLILIRFISNNQNMRIVFNLAKVKLH